MSQSNRVSLGMWALLFASIGAAIGFQVFADALQGLFDRLVLRPQVRKERADLRAAASTLARIDPTPSPLALDEAEFNRLTRRALSHLGDLPRLAASPLAHLPIIEQRLAGRGAAVDTLARAAELKALLSESIARLKPPGNNEFGITQEWRHYNALYFPYVLGLKPYSQGFYGAELPLHAQDALDWFRANVPERTLYNWQNAAAKLVAQQLREQCETEMA